MDRLGFIHEELDIKLLILFILRRLPSAVEPDVLLDLCQCDGGVGYFEYSDCLHNLIDTGHIEETEEGWYKITAKGIRNSDTVESSLPYSVRTKATRLIVPVEERMRRDAMITTRHDNTAVGCIVELGMADGQGEVINLRFLCDGEEQARQIEKKFRKDAETYYQKIVMLMLE